jgi:hypothetical protein
MKGLNKWTDSFLKKDDYNKKLFEIGNKKNYKYKANKLRDKVLDEISLWERKGQSAKLTDLKKDLLFLDDQIKASTFDKERLDTLATKYSI